MMTNDEKILILKKMTEWFKVIFFPLVFFKINIMFSTNMLHIPQSTEMKLILCALFTRCHGEFWYQSSTDDGLHSLLTHKLNLR